MFSVWFQIINTIYEFGCPEINTLAHELPKIVSDQAVIDFYFCYLFIIYLRHILS